MANAPRPGSTRPPETITITIRDRAVVVTPSDFGALDEMAVRAATRGCGDEVSLAVLWQRLESPNSVGLDTLLVIAWAALRKVGEAPPLRQWLEDAPTFADVMNDPTVVTASATVRDDEAPEPVAGGDADPLDSGAA